MTITLNVDEAQRAIRNQMRLDVNDIVNITDVERTSTTKTIESIVHFGRCGPHNKIEFIKKLREAVPGLGLYEAKMTVENPYLAIESLVLHGKISF